MLYDRLKEGGHGGILPGYLGSDWIRCIVYKNFNLLPKPMNQSSYQLLFVERTNTRKWANATFYKTMIQNYFHKVLHFLYFHVVENPVVIVFFIPNFIIQSSPNLLSS